MCSIGKRSYREVKSLLTDYPSAVYNSLLGIASSNKNVVVLENHQIIMRRDHRKMQGKVKIIGGGGAGIEPAESYYVGKGMLTAAVVGNVFTAPSAEEILIAIRELAWENPEGILLLVKNYLGDKLNFGIALDRALREDITVHMLLIGDDISDISSKKRGRKGLAGSVLVYKIAGEMAEQGKTIEEIVDECRENILTDLVTASVSLVPCCNIICDPLVPYIEPNEMIVGMGIYGQHGAKKLKLCGLSGIVSLLVEELFSSQLSFESNQSNVVVMVNNLGATSKLEEGVIAMEVSKQLREKGVNVVKLYAGTFMSSLNTQGFSISLLKINSPDTLLYLQASTSAPAWPVSCDIDSVNKNEAVISNTFITVPPVCQHDKLNSAKFQGTSFGPVLSEKESKALKQVTMFAAEALISCEKQLNIIDSEVGDADAGTVLKRAADVIRSSLINEELNVTRPSKFLFELSEICSKHMGGLAGALYNVFFDAAAKVFQNSQELSLDVCCNAFKSAVCALKHYSRAELGDRTVLDALWPAVESFEGAIRNGENLTQAMYRTVATCEYKAEETKLLKPVWMIESSFSPPWQYADAGAHAASIWLRAVTEAFAKEVPCQEPGIFLWKFLTKEDANYLLESDGSSETVSSFFENKIGADQRLLIFLLQEFFNYCSKRFQREPKRTSALIGTVYNTHVYFTASAWRTPSEAYYYFRESILCHSIESPPVSIEIFQPDEARDALVYFFEVYIRNLPLVRILHLPNYKLHLKLREENTYSATEVMAGSKK